MTVLASLFEVLLQENGTPSITDKRSGGRQAEYRPRDIGLPPEGREKRSNGPWENSFKPSRYMVNGTQVPVIGQLAYLIRGRKF